MTYKVKDVALSVCTTIIISETDRWQFIYIFILVHKKLIITNQYIALSLFVIASDSS